MKNNRGITMVALVIMIILMAILIGTTINYGLNSVDTIKFQSFKYELEQIQGKVDLAYEKIKLGDTSYYTVGSNVTDSLEASNTLEIVKRIKYSNILESQREEYYYQDRYTYYRCLTQGEIQQLFDITSEPGDMIINFKTREVISVFGFPYKDKTYYSLDQLK